MTGTIIGKEQKKRTKTGTRLGGVILLIFITPGITAPEFHITVLI
jgi:hypothetical protein